MQTIKVKPPIIYDVIGIFGSEVAFYNKVYNQANKSYGKYGRGILYFQLDKNIAHKLKRKPENAIEILVKESMFLCQSWERQVKFLSQIGQGLDRTSQAILNPIHQQVTSSEVVAKYKPRTEAAIVISVSPEFCEIFGTEIRAGFFFNIIDRYGVKK